MVFTTTNPCNIIILAELHLSANSAKGNSHQMAWQIFYLPHLTHTEFADALTSEGLNFPLISWLQKVRPWIQSKVLEHLCWYNLSVELLAETGRPCSSAARCSTSHLPHYWQTINFNV